MNEKKPHDYLKAITAQPRTRWADMVAQVPCEYQDLVRSLLRVYVDRQRMKKRRADTMLKTDAKRTGHAAAKTK